MANSGCAGYRAGVSPETQSRDISLPCFFGKCQRESVAIGRREQVKAANSGSSCKRNSDPCRGGARYGD